MERLLAALALVAALAQASAAGDAPSRAPDSRRGPRGPDVEAIVPVPPYEHERLHFFGRHDHHLLPGTVTIDRAPYQCDVDQRRFTSGDDFVAHLRRAHHRSAASIPDALVVREGIVHFVGN